MSTLYNFTLSIKKPSGKKDNSDKALLIDTTIKKPRLNVSSVVKKDTVEKVENNFSELPGTLYDGYKLLEKSFTQIIKGILDKHKGESYKIKLDPSIAADMVKMFGEIKEELTFDDYFFLMRTTQNIGKELATRGTK